MRKSFYALFGAAALALSVTAAQAQDPAKVYNLPTIDLLGCTLLDGHGGFVFIQDGHVTVANDKNGNSIISCHAKGVPTDPDFNGSMLYDFAGTGLTCNTGAGETFDWHNAVTPSGVSNLVCVVHPDQGGNQGGNQQ